MISCGKPFLPFLLLLFCGWAGFTLTTRSDQQTKIPGAANSEISNQEQLGFSPSIDKLHRLSQNAALFGPCDTISFHRLFKPANSQYTIAVNDVIETLNQELIIIGSKDDVSGNTDALIMKTDKYGAIMWQRSFDKNRYDFISKIVRTNGGFFVAGNLGDNLLLAKIDDAGNFVWTKTYTDDLLTFSDIINTTDGSVLISAYRYSFSNEQSGYLLKIDANGNLIWSNYYDNPGNDVFNMIAENGSGYVVTARSSVAGADAVIMMVDKNSGSISWSKRYDFDNRIDQLLQIQPDRNGFRVSGMSRPFNSPGAYRQITGVVDNSGNLTQPLMLMTPYNVENADLVATPDGYIALQTNRQNDTSLYAYRFDASSNLQWGVQQSGGTLAQIPAVKTISGGYMLFAAMNTSTELHLLKTDNTGKVAGCPGIDVTLTTTIPVVTETDFSWTIGSGKTSQQDVAINLLAEQIEADSYCSSSCDVIKIDGADTVCLSQDSVHFKIQKRFNCTLPAQWKIDPTVAIILATNDSSIVLRFNRTGTFKLEASINTTCTIIKDTTRIYVTDSNRRPLLGSDFLLCDPFKQTLHAGTGFKAYLWQNGSTDSVLNITKGGAYNVSVMDYCGNVYYDTVIVTEDDKSGIDLGADIIKCQFDTIDFAAPAGFTKYQWGPVAGISSDTGQQIKIFTASDQQYKIVAQKPSGCTVLDSVLVLVQPPISLELPVDTPICRGATVELIAARGFTGYIWNTGDRSPSIQTDSPGVYSLRAVDFQGCTSTSITDVRYYDQPPVDLGPDTTMCLNTSRTFVAGEGFSNYLWQDGSKDPFFTTTIPGTFWVTTEDDNGCISSDTVAITGYRSGATGFLPDVVEICDGKTFTLSPTQFFIDYRWSTNESTPEIIVSKPGIYTVEVTDFEGCIGGDTVQVVRKDCSYLLVFPNAFTPVGRSNNVFKPFYSVPLLQYHLVVYNRWGQKVYEGKDPDKGWDGNLNGSSLPTQTFVYVCTYQFRSGDQKLSQVKGTITLIR